MGPILFLQEDRANKITFYNRFAKASLIIMSSTFATFWEDLFGSSFATENQDLAEQVQVAGIISMGATMILLLGIYLFSGCDSFKVYKFVAHRDLGWIVYMLLSSSFTLLSYSILVASFWVGFSFNYLFTMPICLAIMMLNHRKISRGAKATSWPVGLPQKMDAIQTNDCYEDLQGTTFGQCIATIFVQCLLLFVFVAVIISKGTTESTMLVPSLRSFVIYCFGFFVQVQYFYNTMNRQFEEGAEFWYEVMLLELSPAAKAEGYQGYFAKVFTLGKGKDAITKKIPKWEIWARYFLQSLTNVVIQSLIAILIPVQLVLTEDQETLLLNIIAAYFISSFGKLASSGKVTVSWKDVEDGSSTSSYILSSEDEVKISYTVPNKESFDAFTC